MKLQNFKTAFSTLARVETSPLQLNPSFTLHVTAINANSQQYLKQQKEFIKANLDHQLIKDNAQFNKDLTSRTITPDIQSYLANVVISGWDLKDDGGKDQPFSVPECLELLNLPDGIGNSVAVAVIDHALNAALYTVDWEQVVVKNS